MAKAVEKEKSVEHDIEPQKISTSDPVTGVYSKAPIETVKKDNVDKTFSRVKGEYITGTHGSFITPLAYYPALQGSKIRRVNLTLNMRMQPLVHVSFSKLKLKMMVVYCSDLAVWENADRFGAQTGSAYIAKVLNVPRFTRTYNSGSGTTDGFPTINIIGLSGQSFGNTTLYRETIGYHYLGRATMANNSPVVSNQNSFANALPLRQYMHICNELFTDKTTTAPYIISKSDVVTLGEKRNFLTGDNQLNTSVSSWDFPMEYGLRRSPQYLHYLNNSRLEVFSDNSSVDNSSLWRHLITQGSADEFRQQVQNIQMTDQEVIAKERGARVADELVPKIVGEYTCDIDLQYMQSSTDAQDVGAGAIKLGADGAYSYNFKEISIPCNFTAPRDGNYHILYTILSPSSINSLEGINRHSLNTTWDTIYRPGLKEIKDDVTYSQEVRGLDAVSSDILGYRRKWSEYTFAGNFFRGDGIITLTTWDNPRNDNSGWLTVPFGGSLARGLNSFANWFLHSSNWEIGTETLRNKVDHTDTNLRRILFVNGGNVSTTEFRRRTEQTFQFGGDFELEITQPIEGDIFNNFIAEGEE